ncbi:ADP-ribosyltransferase [Microbacterium sp. M1A1_1b]
MSLIDPDALPGAALQPADVTTSANTVATLGSTITTGGGDTVRAWQAISGSYQSDGAEHLYDVMTPVGTATTTLGDGLTAVAAALTTYAETVTPIKTKLDTLRTDAEDFVYRAKHFQPKVQDSDDGYVIASQAVSTLGVSLITGTKVEITSWDQDPDMVAENNRLIRRGADLAEQWLAAQQTCANAILGAADLAPLPGSASGTPAQVMAAAEASMPWAGQQDIVTPWGSTGDRKESCGEKTAGFPAHLVKGVVVDGLGGMAKGLSSLLTGWDGTGIPWYAEAIAGGITGRSDMVGDAFDRAGQTFGGSWLGLGHLASALSPIGTVVNTLGNTPLGNFLPEDTQQFLSDWGHDDTTALADTVGGLVGLKLPDEWWNASSWDGYNIAQSWVDDPGGAAGASAFNIGTLFIPGAGEASAGAHATAAAADAAGDVARAGGFADDAARAARGADGFVDAAKGITGTDLAGVAKGVDAEDVAKVTREGDLPTTSVDLAGDAAKVDVPPVTHDVPPAGHDVPPVAHDAPPAAHDAPPAAHDAPPAAHDAPPAAHDAPPAAHDAPPAAHDAPPTEHVPPHTGLDAPPPGAPADTPLPALDEVNKQYRTNDGTGFVKSEDEWATAVSEAYPTLTKDDVLGLYDYTTSHYGDMNDHLRDLHSPADAASLEADISRTTDAIAKLPPVEGTFYRGVQFDTSTLDGLQVGKPWSDEGFISTSTDPTKAFPGNTVLTIEGKTGVNVKPFSDVMREDEVLFQRHTQFEVVSKELVDGKWRITLREGAGG